MIEIKQIAKALIEAQKEMGNAKKDSANPYFKSKYADLNSVREACLPALNSKGISVLQPTIQIEGKNFVKTILLHESGESIECLTEILFSKQNDPQAQGSGITYARRYGLQSLVCLGAEDDDGNKASATAKELVATIDQGQGIEIEKLCEKKGVEITAINEAYKIHAINHLPTAKFNKVIATLKAKPDAKQVVVVKDDNS